MAESHPRTNNRPHSMLDILDQALLRHLERITGTGNGIQGVPLDLMTVACLVLMAERAGEDPGSGGAGLQSRETLEKELSEMGLDDAERFAETFERLRQNGYVESGAEGRLVPSKVTLSMARLLDHAFPGMPGMNLVAYFVQTLDEVETGRKAPRDALSHLDQMLRRHGAAPFGKGAALKKSASPGPGEPSSRKTPPRPAPVQKPHLPPRPTLKGIWTPPERPEPAPEPPSPPQDVRGEEPLEDVKPGEDAPPPLEEVEGDAAEPVPEPVEEEGGPEGHEEEVEGGGRAEVPDLTDPPSQPAAGGSDDVPAPDPEAQVDGRVAAFEEELAMQCPVCHMASVEVRRTAKGRTYYQCADEQCMFISWGRPHYVPCPLCGNPFLVEAAQGNREGRLKCPRATCRYKESDPGEAPPTDPRAGAGAPSTASPRRKRRVVRRKVRRKKG